MMTLVLGNKNYSSWSLRGWLSARLTGAPFEEIVVPLSHPDTAATIARHSPAGRVPILHDGEITVWDSLAIAEYLAEKFPAARLWPEASAARALARSMCAEMHSGFPSLRAAMPMNIRRSSPGVGRGEAVQNDLARIVASWRDCRARFGEGGPFLFGRPTLADAFYAPVVARFRTYAVELDAGARAYSDAIWSWAPMREWEAAAKQEPFSEPQYDL